MVEEATQEAVSGKSGTVAVKGKPMMVPPPPKFAAPAPPAANSRDVNSPSNNDNTQTASSCKDGKGSLMPPPPLIGSHQVWISLYLFTLHCYSGPKDLK
eukprot:scaffold250460_cov17-Prasinocladus_malaysianus.AAC.1